VKETIVDDEGRHHLKEAGLTAAWGFFLGIVFFVLFPAPQETWMDALIDSVGLATGLGSGTLFVRTAQRHYRTKSV